MVSFGELHLTESGSLFNSYVELTLNNARKETRADTSEHTLAVLPFKILGASADEERDYLRVGLADSLITKMSNVRSLTVRPTSAVLRYGARGEDVAATGRELKVESVLDGSVQRAGDRVRVTVQLVRAGDGKLLWADTYDTDFKNIFQVQDEISAQVAEALKVQLTGSARERLTRRPTDDIEAYQLYMRGNYYLYKFTPDGLQKAVQYFNKAIERDSTYALAYAGLANAYGIASSSGDDKTALRAEAASIKAVELDPTLADTHAALAAWRFWLRRDVRLAQDSFNRALELNPKSAITHYNYAWFLTATSRFDEAERHMRRALELDPLSPAINADQGLPLFYARRYGEARRRFGHALESDADLWFAHVGLGETCEALRDFACAVGELERAVALSNGDPSVRTLLSRALALAGRKEEARRMLNEVTTEGAPRHASSYYVALAYVALDERDEAFAWLDRAISERDKWVDWIIVDPRLDPLRDDARFNPLPRRAGFERPSG
jgi:TolB-like protein